MDDMLLTVLAYDDRFVAICHPPKYNVIMNLNVYGLLLVLLPFLLSFLAACLILSWHCSCPCAQT
jgi:hypothetical protein